MVYVIDYGTGVKMTAKSLLMAKRTAGEFAGYTGKDIVIEDIDVLMPSRAFCFLNATFRSKAAYFS